MPRPLFFIGPIKAHPDSPTVGGVLHLRGHMFSFPVAGYTHAQSRLMACVIFACASCMVGTTSAQTQSESAAYPRSVSWPAQNECGSTPIKQGDDVVLVPNQGEFVMMCRTITTTSKAGKVISQQEVCGKPKFVQCVQ
jgi:hypothetical protein